MFSRAGARRTTSFTNVSEGRRAGLPGKPIASGAPGAATTGPRACSRSSTARRASPIFSTRDTDDSVFAALRGSELIGRPLGDEVFLASISRRLNRVVTPRKRGRKAKGDVAGRRGKRVMTGMSPAGCQTVDKFTQYRLAVSGL